MSLRYNRFEQALLICKMNFDNLEAFHNVSKKFPCRRNILKTLLSFVNEDYLPSTLFVYGHSGTGKSALLKELLIQTTQLSSYIVGRYFNCVEYCTNKQLLQSIIEELNDVALSVDYVADFILALRSLETSHSYVLIFDNAERLRDMDGNTLNVLLRLQSLSNLNVCVIFISQLPYEKFFTKSGAIDVISIHFPQYSKSETLQILSNGYNYALRSVREMVQHKTVNDNDRKQQLTLINSQISIELFQSYLNLLLSVFYKACRDLPELQTTAFKYFVVYVMPIIDGSVKNTDVAGLWRLVAPQLKEALSQVYMRFDQPQREGCQQFATSSSESGSLWNYAKSLELPYYAKYLLIAAFLASYNSPKSDKRIFVKQTGTRKKKTMQSVNAARARIIDKVATSLGPKSFRIDRLLAIFYSILDERVGLTCNLLSQISTLVHLKLLCFVAGENNVMECTARLQCTVSLEFVIYIGKLVGFNVQQYLCDFL